LGLVLATLLGGSLAAGSANAINNYVDRDIDQLMARTAHRPLAKHAVDPTAALRFGIVLGVASFVWLVATVNLLSAVLAVAAILFYVFVYTLGLKRRSPQNIVIGGAAGCVPVLVGWAAVTGEVGLPALLLFAIVFAWTPPHFWALALKYREDYARAGVPMMPVVYGVAETARQILLYSILLVSITLMFGPVGQMGLLYLTAAVGLGGVFIYLAWRLLRTNTEQMAMRLFRYSITYLGLLFTAMAIDAALSGPLV
jgi:protoheme IX farnesyltransferase